MSAHSAIYVGSVTHRRFAPRSHSLRYRAFWLLLDLDELPALTAKLRLFSYNRPNLFSLHDVDHGDGSRTPLRVQIDCCLREGGIDLTGGAVRLLCMPRTLGYSFNPLSIYFCYRADDTLAAVMYEVHNTFGERHSYLIPADTAACLVRQRCHKTFYVSPFMDMEMRYEFRVYPPDSRIAVAIRAKGAEGPLMNACLAGARRDLTDPALLRAFMAVPAVTLKVITAVHWHALRLWLKGLRFRPRPPKPDRQVTIVSSSANSD